MEVLPVIVERLREMSPLYETVKKENCECAAKV